MPKLQCVAPLSSPVGRADHNEETEFGSCISFESTGAYTMPIFFDRQKWDRFDYAAFKKFAEC
jgi:hypothetical protein